MAARKAAPLPEPSSARVRVTWHRAVRKQR